MSDTTQVKENLEKILDRCLSSVVEHKAVENVTVNKALDKYCRDIYSAAINQMAGLKDAASSAGIMLNESPLDVDSYLEDIKEVLSRYNEVQLLAIFADHNALVQKILDQLSHESTPEDIQAYVDQLITIFATPIPEQATKDAADAEIERAAERERSERNRPPPAADVLGWIQTESRNTQYSTGRMQKRWAKDFMNGDYGKRAQALAAAKDEGKFIGYNTEGGASYIRIDGSMTRLCWNWDRVGKELPDTTGYLTAESLYNAYDKALDEYFGLIEKIAKGLRQQGVASLVGKLFVIHLENHKGYTKTAGDKIITATKSLDKEKAVKVVEWAEKTQSKLDDAIKAAKGH